MERAERPAAALGSPAAQAETGPLAEVDAAPWPSGMSVLAAWDQKPTADFRWAAAEA